MVLASAVSSRSLLVFARRAFCVGDAQKVASVSPVFVRSDFGTVSSINSKIWDNMFDRYNQGIRDHLKSADCQLLSFIGYSAQHTDCKKHTFSKYKSTTRKWTVFAKLSIFGSILLVCFHFFVNLFERRPHKMTFGPPLPRGCYLVLICWLLP